MRVGVGASHVVVSGRLQGIHWPALVARIAGRSDEAGAMWVQVGSIVLQGRKFEW